jgi:TfoX/Sxy family transcriptional regulator of competence genes
LAEEAKIAGLALKQYFEDQKNRTITKSINWTLKIQELNDNSHLLIWVVKTRLQNNTREEIDRQRV